ncbi:MAG: hypothetical protein KZQ76_11830 [Candidatus Thiodiazotropha sp. (ex Epidulcina cf. delphinae)]|nr:hypothetical protein [Candidatus Thiodiazotropha sp. (ex Epidulcina cf. delphinae)]
MKVYQDEYLSYWGDAYIANRSILKERGILFETFLQAPRAILEAAAFFKPLPLTDDFYPLLPAQRIVQDRLVNKEFDDWFQGALERELLAIKPTGDEPIRHVNGTLLEPLKHHTYPRKHSPRRVVSCD